MDGELTDNVGVPSSIIKLILSLPITPVESTAEKVIVCVPTDKDELEKESPFDKNPSIEEDQFNELPSRVQSQY